jgi:hypothetical protein
VQDFQRGFDLRGAENEANLNRDSGRRLWLRVNGATEGAARPTLACRCRCYGSVRRKSREQEGFSPRKQASGEDDGVHEATQREIDAAAGA